MIPPRPSRQTPAAPAVLLPFDRAITELCALPVPVVVNVPVPVPVPIPVTVGTDVVGDQNVAVTPPVTTGVTFVSVAALSELKDANKEYRDPVVAAPFKPPVKMAAVVVVLCSTDATNWEKASRVGDLLSV